MTHIPRIRPPLLGPLLMSLSALTVLAILIATAVSLVRNPPPPAPQVSYVWGGR